MKTKYLILMSVLVYLLGQVAYATSAAEKEWAFLIFLNGNNSLVDFADLNIKQLETVGSTKDVDVIVQLAKQGDDKTHRLRVEKSTDPNKVTSPFLESFPRVDMGDYKNLVEFVRWSVERFPAKHYFVSFWNHGSGWKRHAPHIRGVSYDDYSGNHISTEQMGIAMKEISQLIGHKVDVVGADACLMAMAEVGSEMSDYVDYFVASEETEPGLGWPYHKLIERWAANPKASGAVITGYLVEEYYKYLSPTDQITLSAMKLSGFPAIWSGMRKLSSNLTQLPTEKLMSIKAGVQSTVTFAYEDYADLGQWMKKASVAAKAEGMDDPLFSVVSQAIAKTVVANKTTDNFKGAEGISIWVPNSEMVFDADSNHYSKLRFVKETGWDEVLKLFLSLPVCSLRAQGQWAEKAVGFSTQYSEDGYAAKQVTGPCDTGKYGDNRNAWAPTTQTGTTEFLAVEYATPVYATGAVIRETYGAGFVSLVEAIDTQGTPHVVWEGMDNSPAGAIADFEASWAKTDYLVMGLKVTVDTSKNPTEWKEIDSIQLLGTSQLFLSEN